MALKLIANNSFNSLKTIEMNTNAPPYLPHDQQILIYNGNIGAVQFVTQGNPALAQSETTFKVTFTATFAAPPAGQSPPPVVMSWGGHIARAADWSAGQSATGISGSPFHMRLKRTLCAQQ